MTPFDFWKFGHGHYIKNGRSMLFCLQTPENKGFRKKNR